ncbi:hypothetical protein H072_4835 [Dactylellina haptotyla CBS 200.50]|uniref:Aminoglycoside phosphotransferase domain-containing protein n=1 Tax=Dactylellina haptotyla (strain CBS 200.50) TaxID=1284197 RepID=S8BP06_DACHA|nr:hypothetical protein H072_4835 [Dactylellina haptotyla CBS 200.50]
MSKIEGKTLKSVWHSLTPEGRDKIVSQLRDYIRQWRTLTADKFGAVGGRPCQEVFFKHWSPPVESILSYGPYNSREEYNAGLVEAIKNSRGVDTLDPFPDNLAQRICALQGEEKILSHGDLHRGNILVNDDAVITGVVDWGSSSFSFMDREYFDTRTRAESKFESWKTAVEQLFPNDEKANYQLFRELERELVIYCGF